MKKYAPYLLYQVARFGALTVPQMLTVCQGKCKQAALYHTIHGLLEKGLLAKIENYATGTRAYRATREGRATVFGSNFPAPSGMRACDLDHTIGVAQVMLEFCQYENVTGIAISNEMKPEELQRFCFERIPDGLIRLSQGDDHIELAVELETSVKATDGVRHVLDRYWQTVRRGMECYGLLVVGTSPQILQRYRHELTNMPDEFTDRVKLLDGICLEGINTKAFGQKTKAISSVLEFTRNDSFGEVAYSTVKSELFLAGAPFNGGTPRGASPHSELEVSI